MITEKAISLAQAFTPGELKAINSQASFSQEALA